APHLATEELPAIVKLGLAPSLAETECIAIGLSSGGGDARREKVSRYVAGEFHIFQAALDKQRRPGLTGRAEELRQIALRSAGHGERIEGGRKIGAQLSRPPHKFGGHKGAGGKADSSVVNRQRVLQRRVDGLLCLLQRQRRAGGGRLELGHVALQRTNRLLLLADLGLRGGGLVVRGGLRLLPVLLRLL